MHDATVPGMRRRFVWSVTLAGLVACSVALGIALTVDDSTSVTAATHPPTLQPPNTTTAPTTRTGTTTRTATTTTTPPNAPEVHTRSAVTTTTLAAGTPAADIGLSATGVADPVTRSNLAEAATREPLPIGDGCEVAVIGDSLMAGAHKVHADTLAEVGCIAEVDGVGGRSLSYGWQCRVQRAGRRPELQRFDRRIPGNDTCAPSGLTLLASWANASALGDVVVVGLGTNDSGLYDPSRRQRNWAEALRLAGGRPVVFLTTQARAGGTQQNRQHTYSEALRQWCAGEELCVLADWANTAAAADPASYLDSVHLNVQGTRARAEFIADIVAALVSGQPLPNP